MQRKIIQDYLKGISLEGNDLVESLFKEIQVCVVKHKNNKAEVKEELCSKYDYLDSDLFELVFSVATLYMN